MKVFVVSLNGNVVASTGAPGENGILTTIVTWVGSSAGNLGGDGQFTFHIGGVDGITGDHLNWSAPNINVGDEINIKIIESTIQEVTQTFTRERFNEEDTQT